MSIRYTDDEAWDFIEQAHTGILTTLRRDGRPVTLPVWFVALDRAVYVTTPSGARKVTRVRHDPRASFLVESGRAWAELTAVHLAGTVSVITDPAALAAVQERFTVKYASFQLPAERMPDAARRHYQERVTLRFVPQGPILSWDNRRLRRPG